MIGDDEIDRLADIEETQSFGAGTRNQHDVTKILQHVRRAARDERIIIDDEDAERGAKPLGLGGIALDPTTSFGQLEAGANIRAADIDARMPS
jgi:hypothetical protein